MAGTHKVSEIKDMAPAVISKLGEANIKTIEELLDKSNTAEEK